MAQDSYQDRLEKFFKWAMWTKGDWCGDVPGEDLQEKAEELGLIEQKLISKPCCGVCKCAEVYSQDEWPVTCYRYTFDE